MSRSAVRARLPALLLALALLCMGLFCASSLRMGGDLTRFMTGNGRLMQLSRRLADSELTRTIIVAVRTPEGNLDLAAEAVTRLQVALADDPELASIGSASGHDFSTATHELYYARRLLMAFDQPASMIAELERPGALKAMARRRLAELSGPRSNLIKQTLPADPIGAFSGRISALTASRQGQLDLHDGVVVDGTWAYLFMTTAHGAFVLEAQAGLHQRIEAAVRDVEVALQTRLTMERSAVGRMGVAAKTSIKADIQRISVLSTLAIVALFVVVFRSPYQLFLAFLPMGAGVLSALTVTQLCYGSVQGLTLAFGATLIGISIDYPLHLINHAAAHPELLRVDERRATQGRRRIFIALALGALTTFVGFGGLGLASSSGLREMALFTGVGIAVALGVSIWVLPGLLPRSHTCTATHRRLISVAQSVLASLRRRRKSLAVWPVLAILLALLGSQRLEIADGVDALQSRNPGLVKEEESVRARVSRMDAGRMVVVFAPGLEAALKANDEVALRLQAAQSAGEVEAFRSLHDFVWSRSLQEQNREAWQQARTQGLAAKLDSAFADVGFRAGAFAGFTRALNEVDRVQVLGYDELMKSPFAELAAKFVIEDGEGIAILTHLRGGQLGALRARFKDLDEVFVYDRAALGAELYAEQRVEAGRMLGFGLLGVFFVLLARYRSVARAFAAYLPALLGAATAFGLLACFGAEFNLMHWVALLLVASMGADYGVFLCEAALFESDAAAEHQAALSLVSVLLACVSTLISFGLLALSSNPAMSALGATTGIGVAACLFLSPVTLVLMPAAKGKE